MMVRECKVCGIGFTLKCGTQKTCSKACSSENARMNRKAYWTHYVRVVKPTESRKFICHGCGIEVTPEGSQKRQRRFCSAQCRIKIKIKKDKLRLQRRNAERNIELESYNRNCIICGTSFVSKSSRGKMCSDHCRKERLRAQDRSYYRRDVAAGKYPKSIRELSDKEKERRREYTRKYNIEVRNKKPRVPYWRAYQKKPDVKEKRREYDAIYRAARSAKLAVLQKLLAGKDY